MFFSLMVLDILGSHVGFWDILDVFLQLCHEPHCPYSELPIKCPRNNFKLPGERMSSADIVDEFAYSHQTWAVEFIEGWQVFTKFHL